ncbi:hypothetical protein MBBTH_01140 [Methanobrevibacter thaueri]|uniref:Right handed beta helix domain-containing protein n=2 Tax=Methanobrevibacter thaueri TaxID=190975 RepID=A0A315XQ38_9EURY|nr:hypothetical protein MBBTH_01140 [Methanobrevibacter thaueri]
MIVINILIVKESVNMKINKFFLIILILVIVIFGIGSISATDDLNDTISTENLISNIEDNQDEVLSLSNGGDDVLADSPKTIEVPFIETQPNEVLWPRIQPAIDKANPGDTVIIKGNPVHCHITINKTLSVISSGGTIDACPHHTHEGVDEYGVFFVAEGGSGSLIQGFTFVNKDKSETPFAVLIRGASDVTVKDCTMNWVDDNSDKLLGIIIENADNIKLSNLFINNTISGITIINSTNVEITNCTFTNIESNAISISGNSGNINVYDNTILNNGYYGINLLSVNNVFIKDNLIKNNGKNNHDSGSGIYVNANITKLVVMGNIFIGNNLHAVMYDCRARNLDNSEGADNLTIVDDNYFEGHNSMILHHRTYVESADGNMDYDAENDLFVPSSNGNYSESKSYVYLQNAFVVDDIVCGFTYYTSTIPWSLEAPGNNGKYNLSLKLSEMKEVKNGVYQISIVDSKGNVASNFNSGYMIFFLNDYSTMEPQGSDIYKKVKIQKGVATADFREYYSLFRSSGNVITAAFCALSNKVANNPHRQLNVSDSNVPINPSTQLSSSGLTLYPLATGYLSVKLVDSKNKAIAGQYVTVNFNGKTYNVKTDNNGIAKVKVSLSAKKTYSVTFTYSGNDDYSASKTAAKIIVKTGSKKSKIKASNMKIKKNKKKSFKFKLTASNGKALSNQKVIVKVNGKTKTLTTNKKGIAKLTIKLKKVKKYKISMKFLGNSQFKPVSKSNVITVTKK